MFVLATHWLFLLGIVGVGLADQSLVSTAVLLALYGIGLHHTYRRGRSIRRSTETVLAVLAAGASVLYSAFQGLHYLFALPYMLALILTIRSFRRMEKRDYAFCFLGSAVLFAHVARTYDEFPFLFLVLAAIVVAPYALFHYLVRYGGFGKTGTEPPLPDLHFSSAQFRFMTGISLALLLVSIVLFLIMPRAGGGGIFSGGPGDRDRSVSGLGENVSLGSFSEVTPRRTIVMTVESDQPDLWRGGVLDYYENGVWYGAARNQQREPGEPPPTRAVSRTARRRFQVFDFRLTGLRLFSAGTVLSVQSLNEGWEARINDVYSTIMVTDVRSAENRYGNYEVTSDPGEFVGSGVLSDRPWPVPTAPATSLRESDLLVQTPTNLSERIRRLALDITRGLNSPEDKARAVQRYLSQGFTYRVRRLDSGNAQPLEYFLFESKAGHCEYFASAMAILLRCAGVRTRVVQGFAAGTRSGGKYVVRLKDAHLWTEVFYPGRGWKSFDPTPGQEDRLRSGEPVGLFEDLSLTWRNYVLNYNRGMQIAMFEGIHHAVVATVGKVRNLMPSLGQSLAALLFVCLALLLRRFKGWLPGLGQVFGRSADARTSISKVRSSFGQYLKEIARKGYKRGPATTPNDLLTALRRDQAPIVEEASLLTRLFYDARFGDGRLSLKLEKDVERAVRRIREWTR